MNLSKIWDFISNKNIEPQDILELVEEVKQAYAHYDFLDVTGLCTNFMTNELSSFYLDIATKETPAHLAVAEIKQYDLDEALEIVRARAPRYRAIKDGFIQPERCEDYNCNYCTETKIITEPIDSNYLGMSPKQIKAANGDFI